MTIPMLLVASLAVAAGAADAGVERLQDDMQAVHVYRQGLSKTVAYCSAHPELFPAERRTDKRMLSREQKEAVWSAWRSFLDYMLALDPVRSRHGGFYLSKGDERDRSLAVAYASFLAQYRWALDFIQLAENDPSLGVVLDEPVPEMGLPAGSYGKLRFEFLNVAKAAQFAAYAGVYRAARKAAEPLRSDISEDAARVWKTGQGRGEIMTLGNGLTILRQASYKAWFPVQAELSEWMGDTKVHRVTKSLISAEQIASAGTKLEPGDILLVRREWYLSNVGLPGFWPHGAIYIGTPEERRRYFDVPEVKAWAAAQGAQDFEALLGAKAPENYRAGLEPYHGHPPRVLEAISEGVSFTSLEHAIDADSMAVLRPRLPKKEKALALLRAFRYAGRPYDFDFDFLTDDKLVCTELAYKAYEPSEGNKGLRFPTVPILGRLATPANVIARQFDEQYGTDGQQTDLVLFLDGQEKAGNAVEADLAEFRRSWRRPKWHVLVQKG